MLMETWPYTSKGSDVQKDIEDVEQIGLLM